MIYETNETFDFQKTISFTSPKSITGGNYFIKCLTPGQNPLYIQTPKGKSKQKWIKTGKKMYGDFVFTQDDESFLKWMEEFEAYCQKTLFEHRSEWFESELEMHDIENSFAASLKIYKSGKQHVLRANIPVRLGKCALKIYDEQEQEVDPETISENTNMIAILEIQGIRCSSRSFQLEYEVKQILVLNPVDIFEKCILLSKKSDQVPLTKKEDTLIEKDTLEKEKEKEKEKENEKVEVFVLEKKEENDLGIHLFQEEEVKEETVKEEVKDLEVIELSIPAESSEEIIQLKKRNEVYFEMYKEAKQKAKMARAYALSVCLEAKRIKNTYLIDEVFDSEDEEEKEEEIYMESEI